MALSEANFRVLATLRDRRGGSRTRSWHDVEAPTKQHAVDSFNAKSRHVVIHSIHNVDSPEGKASHARFADKVVDTKRDRTPAFNDDEKKTLFGRVQAALGKKKKSLPSFGGTVKR